MPESFQHFSFTFDEVKPTKEEILDFIKSSELEEEHPAVVFVNHILDEIDAEKISGGYVIKNVEPIVVKEGKITIDNMVLEIDVQLCGYIKEATQVALFVCTAGEYFTSKTNELNNAGDIMEAYILDAIGSLTVEKAMDKIQQQLAENVKFENLKISNRYSPGYCNWHLSGQEFLFKLIGENPTGVSINSSCLMTPRKSVSGLIGIGEKIKSRDYGCEICNNATCIYRKILHK